MQSQATVLWEPRAGYQLQHRCHLCGELFTYQHDGHYNVEQLRPVDWVCRSCFPDWLHSREEH